MITNYKLILPATVGLVVMPLCGSLAFEAPQVAQIPLGKTTKHNLIFVNPIGDQTIENGSESSPYKTITQALRVALPNTVIVLSRGTYSSSSGETFPIELKPGVSIQGDPRTRGSKIVIQGGGTFLSPTFARQNITLLGANRARVTGVTVTNPNPRGYGLWIESTSPVVVDNTFTGNKHDGISITGNSAPTIQSNYFYKNGANGMTIYGTSQPLVRENVFKKTGFGINIAQKAAPLLIGNQISQNRAGVIAQANTRPVLRNNVIEGNTEDGLVAIANSQPNLGTKTEPGGNVFRQNGRYDINSKASSQTIPAFGNQLANRTSGRIDLAGLIPLVTPAVQLPSNTRFAQYPRASISKTPPVLQPNKLVQSAAEQPPEMTAMTPIVIPVPPPVSTQVPSIGGNTQLDSPSDTIVRLPIPLSASSVVAPPPPSDDTQTLPVLKPASILVSDILPVPSSNIPIGNSRKASPRTGTTTPSAGTQLPLLRTSLLAPRFRVVVEAESKSKQEKVRSLVPGAFRTFSNGRAMMQVGIFSNRANANEVLQMLDSQGMTASIQQLP